MFKRNKENSAQVGQAVAKAVNYEVTIADIARRSERRAWIVAWCAIAMSVMLAGGYYFMLPLKERVPYLVMADAFTGTATVARLRDDFRNASITSSEAINRSNVAHFVMARESYDLALQSLRDWTTVYTMSSPEVASGYTTLHARNNPNAPFKLYGGTRSIRVRILSIVFMNDAQGRPNGATVRFQRSVFEKDSGVSRSLDGRLATLAFTYKNNLQMDEKYRIENPLGFQVTSYRVDNDYASAPPLQEDVSVAPPLPATMPQQSMSMDAAALASPEQPAASVAVGTSSQPAAAQPGASTAGAVTPAETQPADGVGIR